MPSPIDLGSLAPAIFTTRKERVKCKVEGNGKLAIEKNCGLLTKFLWAIGRTSPQGTTTAATELAESLLPATCQPCTAHCSRVEAQLRKKKSTSTIPKERRLECRVALCTTSLRLHASASAWRNISCFVSSERCLVLKSKTTEPLQPLQRDSRRCSTPSSPI